MSSFTRLIRKLSKVDEHELKACLVSFSFVFTLMASYYILRPVRDAMASDWTDAEVSFLWTLNFFVSSFAVALYGWMVSYMRFDRLVPAVYIFFASSFVAFYLTMGFTGHPVWMDKTFYLWVSVFSLFHISVFWSFMSDLFSKEQAGRLFSIIGAGASAGALLGPAIPALFASFLGTSTLLLIAAVLLLLPVPLILYLSHLKVSELGNTDVHADLSAARIGGNPFAGFKIFFSSRYLLGIGAFIMLYTAIASFVYFQQKNLLAPFDREARTQILGAVDWVVNVFTFIIAFFATGRILEKFGMPTTLASVPLFIAGGLLVLASSPILAVALAIQVARRAGNYAVTRPAREMLFTVVDRETRFKAKPVIDIVAYRGGDMVTSWLFAGLTQGLGLGLGSVAAIGAAIAGLWAWVAVYLGRAYDE